jgi:outer membrane protein TolC
MRERIADGKLRLTLRDAIVLTLMNNTGVRIQELSVETAKYGLLQVHAPFDPRVTGGFTAQRATVPTTDELKGAETLNTLAQTTTLSYIQTLESGTNLIIGFNASKLSTNSTSVSEPLC